MTNLTAIIEVQTAPEVLGVIGRRWEMRAKVTQASPATVNPIEDALEAKGFQTRVTWIQN